MQGKAISWRQKVVAISRERAREKGGNAFFPEVFRIADELIEHDTGEFCDLAEEVFEEIEAFGQEPQLDEDWLGELTGERDSFYFSTESLVRELEPLPGRKRGRKPLSDLEVQRLTREIENAIIDENEPEQSFEQALAVAHGENVQDWINSIKRALSDSENREIDFWRLQQLTRLRPTELFLGLLLGQEHWTIGQREFYGQLFVCRRGSGRGRRKGGGGGNERYLPATGHQADWGKRKRKLTNGAAAECKTIRVTFLEICKK